MLLARSTPWARRAPPFASTRGDLSGNRGLGDGLLFRAAMTSMVNAAREIRNEGTFAYTDRCMSTPDWYALQRRDSVTPSR